MGVVYQISNLVSGKKYIGSTVNHHSIRFNGHKRDLKNQKHHNQPLQRAWNKYGESSFRFEILCATLKEQTVAVEQLYIDWLKPEYNTCKIAGSALGVKHSKQFSEDISKRMKGNTVWRGRTHTEESKAKISIANKGKQPIWTGCKRPISVGLKISKVNKGRETSAETKIKMSKARKGKTPWNAGLKGVMKAWNKGISFSTDSKNKMRQAKLKFNWIIKEVATGQIFETTNLTQFCKDKKLTVTNIHQKRVTGEFRSHKGFQIISKTNINENKAA